MRATPRILTESRLEGAAGFTLLEILVVVAIIGLMTAVAVPGIRNYFRVSLNSATRELASALREAYNSAVISGRVHRIAYDLDKNEFWVEAGPAAMLLHTEKSREEEERRKRRSGEEGTPSGPPFSLASRITSKHKSLPLGVKFEDIVSKQAKEPLIAGIAYTHIFPHGLTESTVVHMRDDQQHQTTLVIEPFLGRARLVERYLKPEEALLE